MNVARYRRDYDGEFVLLEHRVEGNRIHEKREWIPNQVSNIHVSDRAAVIGSNIDLELFDWRRLHRHKGGLLAKKRLQTYGSGSLWRDMRFNFFVSNVPSTIYDIADSEYHQDTVVYTTSNLCIDNPGKFYIVPYLPSMDELAIAVYLAAFDEHREIFLLGYTNETPAGTIGWIADVNRVLRCYESTRFIFVGVEANVPRDWRYNANVSTMNYRDFISYCDV